MCVLKMKLLCITVQKLQPEQTHRQTDRQTDRKTDSTEIITLSAYADGNDMRPKGKRGLMSYLHKFFK